MDHASTAYLTAKKRWNQRNSDGKFCYDQDGELVTCQSPPGFAFADVDMPAGMSDDWPVDGDVGQYQSHAVTVTHVWDSSLSDPDS